MAVQIVLMRGINLGSRNRIAMPELRELLTEAGFADVRTYLQSGNVVLSTRESSARLTNACELLIKDCFGLDIRVVVRKRAELAAVVRRNPFGKVAVDPKRYQVSFLSASLDSETVRRLEDAVVAPERFAAIGRELYAWHPDGIARSRLWAQLAGRDLGVTATARNWSTVTSLLALAEDSR